MTLYKSTKRRRNDRQYIWDYMRRNRIFKIEDLLTIVDEMSLDSMKVFFKQLEHAGFVKVRMPAGKRNKPKMFKNRTFGFIKNSGALCPVWMAKQKCLYDRNNQEMQVKDTAYVPKESKKIEHRPVDPMEYDKGRIMQILEIKKEAINLLQLSERSGVSNGRFSIALVKLKEEGLVEEIGHDRGVPMLREVVNVS